MNPALQAIVAAAASFVAVTLIVCLLILICRLRKSSRPPNNININRNNHNNHQHQHRHQRHRRTNRTPQRSNSSSGRHHPRSTMSAVDESATFDPSLSRVSMQELIAATRDFAPDGIIGDGSFGFVYKARLNNGVTVAVKKLSREAFQGLREFRAEMETLGGIRHSNLVKMMGFCSAGDDRVLIYEFVERGSLDQWLYDSSTSGKIQPLTWFNRIKIVRGVASGLRYLHEDCDPRIIHRDIKASNVLLDSDFEAHIADFGLARRMDGSHSHVSTQVAGTMGYMPPEYKDGLTLATVMADVYSFGILMVEVATGKRPNWPVKAENGKEASLIAWTRKMIEEGKEMDIVDPWVFESGGLIEERDINEFFRIAYVCTQDTPRDRPTMGEVLKMLERLQAKTQAQAQAQPEEAQGQQPPPHVAISVD